MRRPTCRTLLFPSERPGSSASAVLHRRYTAFAAETFGRTTEYTEPRSSFSGHRQEGCREIAEAASLSPAAPLPPHRSLPSPLLPPPIGAHKVKRVTPRRLDPRFAPSINRLPRLISPFCGRRRVGPGRSRRAYRRVRGAATPKGPEHVRVTRRQDPLRSPTPKPLPPPVSFSIRAPAGSINPRNFSPRVCV